MKDTIQTIRRSSHRFFSGTVLSRVSGMFRDMSMAYAFGTQPSIAAFMVAFRFAHLLRRLFGEGALQTAFIPEFEALRHENQERAFAFFRSLTHVLTLFLVVVITIGCIALASFVWSGHLQPGNQEIVFLTLIMLPSLLFICLFGLNASLLQCEKSYFVPSVAPVTFNAIWVVTVLLLKEMPPERAMPWLSFGVVIACLFQWLITLPRTRKSLKEMARIPQSLRASLPDLIRLGKPLALGILGVAASQINSALDSLFARFAESEGPAWLWYAIRIQQLPLALFGIAIAGAILPPLSRSLKAGRTEEYHHFLEDALSRTWFFMLPITAALFVMGDIGVNFLFGRGDFGPPSVIQTTYCLWAYGIGLIPSALVIILAPAYYAKSNYLLPTVASFTSMLLNLILNSWFIMGLGWGSVSVAIATSLSAWVNLLLLGWNLSKEKPLLSYRFITDGMIVTVSACAALFATYEVRLQLQLIPFFSDALFAATWGKQLILLAGQGTTFLGIYFMTLCSFNFVFQRDIKFRTKKI